MLDPDFGWHIKIGEIITTQGIPYQDPFSYTMPSYPLVNHEWLFDVILSNIYSILGKYVTAVLFSIIGISILILSSRTKFIPVNLFLLILIATTLQPTFAISPRVIAWLLFSVIIYIINNENLWKKVWRVIPLLFLLWTNLHGSFILGLLALGIVFVTKSYSQKKVQVKEIIILTLSFFVTFINPYKERLWSLVWSTTTSSLQRDYITEWKPTYLLLSGVPFSTFFILALFTVLLVKYRKRFILTEIFLYITFFIFALFAIRNLTFWVLVTVPMLGKAIEYLYSDLRKVKWGEKRFNMALKWSTAIVIIIFFYQIFRGLWHITFSFNEQGFYPSKAVNYLSNNLPKGNIFSEYNWGGYLIWKLPEKKIFICGLMPSWIGNDQTEYESQNAMEDYMRIIIKPDEYKPIFEKFGIDTVLISKPTTKTLPKILSYVKSPADNSRESLNSKLLEDNWKVVYEDDVSVVYQR